MTDGPQIIRDETGKPAFAVIPIAEYERLVDAAEEAADIRAVDAYRQAGAETFPDSVAERLLTDCNPVTVFREYRGLSRAALARKAGLSAAYLTQIETGLRRGSVDVLKGIARALDVDLDLLT